MRNISDLKENEVIHCRTQEEWDGVLKLMENPRQLSIAYYNEYKENTVLFIDGTYESVDFAIETGHTIHPASLFLTPPVSLTRTIGEYTLLKHDGKIFVIKDLQAITLTTEIINAIKEMI